jgi:2-methylaconitate cis-trans-isomerase PrpF
MGGTGAVCLAVASRIVGSVPHRMLGHAGDLPDTLRSGHPLGVMDVVVALDPSADGPEPGFARLGFARTARRFMDGLAYVPKADA